MTTFKPCKVAYEYILSNKDHKPDSIQNVDKLLPCLSAGEAVKRPLNHLNNLKKIYRELNRLNVLLCNKNHVSLQQS